MSDEAINDRAVEKHDEHACQTCNGSGVIPCDICHLPHDCDDCDGWGTVR